MAEKTKIAIMSVRWREGKFGKFLSGTPNPEYFKDAAKGLKLLATEPDKYELTVSFKDKASENSPDGTIFVKDKFKPAPKKEYTKPAAKAADKEGTPW